MSYFSFEIVIGTVNVSSDVIVLGVAIPLIARLRIPMQQKAVLLVVFGMGIFVVVAALLNKILTVGPFVPGYNYLNWYFREASVSVYVIYLPALLALVRRVFPSVNDWGYRTEICGDNHPSMQLAGDSLCYMQGDKPTEPKRVRRNSFMPRRGSAMSDAIYHSISKL